MRLVITLYLILVLKCLHAQEDTLVFYPVNNNRLQQSEIRSINIDKNDKLWLSTSKGILCFDGNNVQTYVSDYGFFKSFENLKNNFYTIQSQGIYLFDTRTGVDQYLNITFNENFSSDPRTYTDIYEDKDGSIWCGRTNGFFHFNTATKKTIFYPLHSASNTEPLAVRNIISDWKNPEILWLATDNGIYKFDKKLQKLKRDFKCSSQQDSVPSDVFISKFYADTTGNIWFAGKRGMGFYDIKRGLYKIYPCQKNLFKKEADIDLKFLQPKSLNEFYIGSSENCPGLFNTQTHQYIFNSKLYKQFSAFKMNDFVADQIGNIWCIISGQLYYASANKNKFYAIPLSGPNNDLPTTNIFKTVIWDIKRKYYYAAFDNSNFIFVLDSSLKLTQSIPIKGFRKEIKQLSEIKTFDISLDNKGRLWTCGTCVSVYDSATKCMVPAEKLYSKLIFREQHFQNIISRNNYLYLQPSNPVYKAIYRIDIVSLTYDSIPIPYNIIPNGYENSWNGKKYQDVAVIDKLGKYAYIGVGNYVMQVNLLTKKGRKITRVTLRDNGYYFNIFWYVLDDDDNLWVSSGDGIKVIDPTSLKIIKKIGSDDVTQRFQLSNAKGLGIVCLLYSGGVALYDYRNGKEYNLSLSDGLITLFNSGVACVNNILFVGAELNVLQYFKLNSLTHKNTERKCYLSEIELFNQPYVTDTLPEYIHLLQLPHDKNFITLTFSSTEFEQPEQLKYRYKLQGVNNDWVHTDYLNRTISYYDLKPGNYIFYTSIQNFDGSWSDSKVNLHITIVPAFWQTTLFKILFALVIIGAIYFFIRWRISSVRAQEQVKSKFEKELLELEAKALRAQMNPHFIFNCMNSIKSLIQKNEHESAINYLTTFSKLIRTIFQNSDKREITLFDELETSRLYTNLESMRFGDKFSYHFNVDENLDLKSIQVPALIIQPFIENAIWHGIMPREDAGSVTIEVCENSNIISCIIDDNGIGREESNQGKFKSGSSTHESKGVRLTQSRLDLDNLLNERKASVEIIDKKDKYGKATGTKVIIQLTEY